MKKISVILDDDLWEKLTIFAAKKRRKKNEVILEALKNYLETKA